MEELIFIRVNKWGKAGKLMTFVSDRLWRVNPKGITKDNIIEVRTKKFLEFLEF